MSKETLLKDLENMRTQMKIEGRTGYEKIIVGAIDFINFSED